MWADLIHLEGAETLASYTDGFYAGTPAVTLNVYGEGAAYYLGTRPKERYTKSLLQKVCEEAGASPTAEAASFLFLLNHTEEAVDVGLPNPGRNLLTGKEHSSNLVLDPLGVTVLRESESA